MMFRIPLNMDEQQELQEILGAYRSSLRNIAPLYQALASLPRDQYVHSIRTAKSAYDLARWAGLGELDQDLPQAIRHAVLPHDLGKEEMSEEEKEINHKVSTIQLLNNLGLPITKKAIDTALFHSDVPNPDSTSEFLNTNQEQLRLTYPRQLRNRLKIRTSEKKSFVTEFLTIVDAYDKFLQFLLPPELTSEDYKKALSQVREQTLMLMIREEMKVIFHPTLLVCFIDMKLNQPLIEFKYNTDGSIAQHIFYPFTTETSEILSKFVRDAKSKLQGQLRPKRPSSGIPVIIYPYDKNSPTL